MHGMEVIALHSSQSILNFQNSGSVISAVSCGSFAVDGLTANCRADSEDASG